MKRSNNSKNEIQLPKSKELMEAISQLNDSVERLRRCIAQMDHVPRPNLKGRHMNALKGIGSIFAVGRSSIEDRPIKPRRN